MNRFGKGRFISWMLLASLALNIFFLARYVIARLKSREVKVQAYTVPKYYLDRNLYLASLPINSSSIVFLGDSHIQYFELAEHFKDTSIRNRGIGGDNIPGLLARIGPIISGQPKKIFIEIGGNDVRAGTPVAVVFAQYKRLLDTLRRTCPASKIYAQTVFPVGEQLLNSESLNPRISKLNTLLLNYCRTQNISCINLNERLFRNESLTTNDLLPDGIHLSAAVYRKWAEVLQPFMLQN